MILNIEQSRIEFNNLSIFIEKTKNLLFIIPILNKKRFTDGNYQILNFNYYVENNKLIKILNTKNEILIIINYNYRNLKEMIYNIIVSRNNNTTFYSINYEDRDIIVKDDKNEIFNVYWINKFKLFVSSFNGIYYIFDFSDKKLIKSCEYYIKTLTTKDIFKYEYNNENDKIINVFYKKLEDDEFEIVDI
jgi:hypothetical protein